MNFDELYALAKKAQPFIIDFYELGISQDFNELVGKGGGSTTISFPEGFFFKIPIGRPILIRSFITAFGYSMTAPATIFHETEGTVVLTVTAKEIINGSLVVVNLNALFSSISVQMIPLA